MTDESLRTSIDLLAQHRPALAQSLRRLSTLEDLFRWLQQPDAPTVGKVETVAQDEFSHDMLLELSDCGDYLVIGAT